MYIAMNRFKVALGSEAAFETHWLARESYLEEMEGFVVFHLLKGGLREDHQLYSSYTLWTSRAAFEGWTQSDGFKVAHTRTGNSKVAYVGPPDFEGFDVLQTVGRELPLTVTAE
jgi:heme-degrading monooxygenase HmoA